MTSHQCKFCEKAFFSNEKRLAHEKICIKNKKTDKERFDEKVKIKRNQN